MPLIDGVYARNAGSVVRGVNPSQVAESAVPIADVDRRGQVLPTHRRGEDTAGDTRQELSNKVLLEAAYITANFPSNLEP